MRSSSILAKLITLASTVGIVAGQGSPPASSTAFPIIVTGVIPTTCTATGQCRSEDLRGITTKLPTTSCPSCTTTISNTTASGLVDIRETSITMNGPTGSSKSATSPPPTGGNPTSTGSSGGGAATKSGSTPTRGTGAATKSSSTPTGGTGSGASSGSGSGSGSRGSSDGTVAPAATTTAPGGSTGIAVRNGGSVVAVVLLASLVGLLGLG